MELAIGENSSEKCWEIGKNHLRGISGREIIGPKKQLGYWKNEKIEGKERKREEKKKRDRRRCQKRNRRKRKPPKMYLVRAAGRSLLVEPRYRGHLMPRIPPDCL